MEIVPRIQESKRRWSLTLILSSGRVGEIVNLAHRQGGDIRAVKPFEGSWLTQHRSRAVLAT